LQIVSSAYVLETEFSGNSFFDKMNFFTANDPTHGTVDYVSGSVAQQKGYTAIRNGAVYIGCDMSTVVATKVRGRQAVRISTQQTWNKGLFIMDLAHMPAGCATWPAWWLVGPNWPNNGEIDIIEGINLYTNDHTTLHTNDGCSMAKEDPTLFTGKWAAGTHGPATNCFIGAPGQGANQGCGIIGNQNTYGAPFNANGGGVYVTEWNSTLIRMFFFPRGQIPSDIQQQKPNPDSWGKPYAYFEEGADCPANHFNDETMVINLTFCGDWAGAAFGSDCPNHGDCASFVRNNPKSFTEAYWLINSITVYQQ